jgi:UDP-glucose 4-epimerase
MENILITGGCGFIGSHVLDLLISNQENVVTVFDNLSSGNLDNLTRWNKSPNFHFAKKDLLDRTVELPRDCDTIYHMAANPDVRTGSKDPRILFEQNILATYNLLEAARKLRRVNLFVFASTSTVYGEPDLIPTPEEYGPLKPISMYGASKLACDALVSSYASTYGFKAIIYRLANVIGRRSTHGIIYDLIQKLRKNPNELEILGDGTQNKSYLHVEDCLEGIAAGVKQSKITQEKGVSIFNLGSEDKINVLKIADIVCVELGYRRVKYKLTPMTTDGRGWPGDVKVMMLDVSRLKSIGWSPRMNSEEAVTRTVREFRN